MEWLYRRAFVLSVLYLICSCCLAFFYPFLFLLSLYYNMDVFSLQVGSMKLLEKEVKYLQKGGVVMDVHAKLRQMMEERNWTEYRMAKECGLAETTVYNIMSRNTMPNLITLEII